MGDGSTSRTTLLRSGTSSGASFSLGNDTEPLLFLKVVLVADGHDQHPAEPVHDCIFGHAYDTDPSPLDIRNFDSSLEQELRRTESEDRVLIMRIGEFTVVSDRLFDPCRNQLVHEHVLADLLPGTILVYWERKNLVIDFPGLGGRKPQHIVLGVAIDRAARVKEPILERNPVIDRDVEETAELEKERLP